jgi:protein subunit release factor B
MKSSNFMEAELRKRQSAQQSLGYPKANIGCGHQIRSYALGQLCNKALHTNYEVGNTLTMLDDDLNDYISARLKQGL